MSRGSLPGERRGGRQRGTPNKKTALRNVAITAAATDPSFSPLDFFRSLMGNPDLPLEVRVMAAEAALPFVHSKPRVSRPDQPAPRKYGEPAPRVNVRRVAVIGATQTAKASAAVSAGNGQDLPPLDFLLALMRDPGTPPQLCIKLAHIVAPYVHPKLGHSPRPVNAFVVDDPFGFVIDPDVARALQNDNRQLSDFAEKRRGHPVTDKRELEIQARVTQISEALVCPEGYTKSDQSEDSERLRQLRPKRKAPRPHNKLTEEEEVEEAHLAARMRAYHNSPEAIAESKASDRQFLLMLRSFSSNPPPTPEELSELAELKALYPYDDKDASKRTARSA